jgi:hypothetical protein
MSSIEEGLNGSIFLQMREGARALLGAKRIYQQCDESPSSAVEMGKVKEAFETYLGCSIERKAFNSTCLQRCNPMTMSTLQGIEAVF